jgi:PEP-CTERM motif
MRHGLLTKFLLLGCAVAAFGTASARADVLLYDNTTGITGSFRANGGAATVGTTVATAMVADDITAGPGLGGLPVNSITFSLANGNSASTATSVTFSPELLFYQSDPNSGAPTTLIAAFNISPITLPALNGGLFTISTPSAGGFFTMPTGLFWAGIVFTDGGTGSATAAELNNLGQFIVGPPTVGSSVDAFFVSTAAGPSGPAPAGTFFNFGGVAGGNLPGDFAWQFTSAVPEPSTLALSAVGGLVLIGVRLTRRRRSAGSTVAGATTV